ncbi:MAG TPA: nucleotidyltransferase domain-containing protein [Candidatus Nanoarchaeia archaeon]|nr:nucleotidyltransferase domain-containing protein [Candidatus Nanoarchaeia archaeon]
MYQKRNNEHEIISLYRGNYAARFYLREIGKRAGLPLKTTQNALQQLERKKVLKSSTEGKNKYFFFNLDNIQAKFAVLQAEVYQTALFLEAYQPFKLFLKGLTTHAPLIVFGSFAKCQAGKDSDLDLLAVSENDDIPVHLLPYKIHRLNMPETTFMKALREQEAVMKEIAGHHIILNNHSFFVDAMWMEYGK